MKIMQPLFDIFKKELEKFIIYDIMYIERRYL